MTDSASSAPQAKRGALTFILVATVISGAVGYLIQAVIPGFLSVSDYTTFGSFWAVTYLVVSALSGIQQELTRVSRSDSDSKPASSVRHRWPLWARFTALCAVVATLIIVIVLAFIAPVVFPHDPIALICALAIAVFGYSLVAGLSAAMYGIKYWPGVAGMTVADSLIRLVLIGICVAFGFGITALGWAIALPFVVAAVLMWFIVGARIRSTLRIDASVRELAIGTIGTVSAALATGVLISGLPFLLRATSASEDVTLVASLMLVITLTRAPLVVPVMALQSFLLVSFRDQPEAAKRSVIKYSGALLALTLVLAGLAALIGPWLLNWLYRGQYELSAIDFGLIVISAGLTGVMCITAPAVLAQDKHGGYVFGWAVAAIVTIVLLIIPFGDWHTRVLLALALAPTVGVLCHAAALRAPAKIQTTL